MVRLHTCLALLGVLFFGFSTPAFAEAGQVGFTSGVYNLSTPVGVPYALDLHTLLTSQGSGQLSWGNTGVMPSWLSLNTTTGVVSGTPSASQLGLNPFTVAVSDGEAGALANIQLTVTDAPIWASNNINLGIQTVGQAWTFNLNTVVTDPLGGTITFSATGLPGWMSLNPNGTLSGTPQNGDIGNYSGIVFTATAKGGASQAGGFGTVVPEPPSLSLSGPSTIPTQTCQPYSVSLSQSGAAFVPTAPVTVAVNVSGAAASGATLYSNSQCSTAVSSVQVPAGQSSVGFYLVQDQPGSLVLNATASAFNPASLPITAASDSTPKIVLSAPTTTVAVGACLPVTLVLEDANNEGWMPISNTAMGLSTLAKGLQFYSDGGCSTVISQATVAQGTSSTGFYVSGTVAGPNQAIVASASGFTSGNLSLNLTPGAPEGVKLSVANPVAFTQSCLAVTLTLVDAGGNPTTDSSDVLNNLALSGSASSSAGSFSDSQCAQAASSVTLPSGSSSVTFYVDSPTAGQLTVAANPPAGINGGSVLLTLNQPPNFNFVGTSNLNFGSIPVGSSKTLPLTLSNSGGAGSLSSISIAQGPFTLLPSGTCQNNLSLAAGASCTLQVQFAPTSAGTFNGAIAVVANNGTLTSQLTGQSTLPPNLAIVGAPNLNFGNVALGSSASLTLTVQNNGGTGSLSTLAISGAPFAIQPGSTCQAQMVLAGGSSCQVVVAFTPTAVGAANGTLQIASNASSVTSQLAGSGYQPSSFTLIGANSLNFGNVLVGGSATQSLTVWNEGGSGTLGTLGISGPGFRISGGSCQNGMTLAANATCTVSVTFAPTVTGAASGSVAIPTNSSNLSASLSGNGVTAGSLVFNPTAVNYGNVNLNTPSWACVTATNVGGSAVTFGAISVLPSSAFAVISTTACGNPCYAGLALNPGASCGVTVQFDPTLGGTQTNTLTIDGSSMGNNIAGLIPLAGNGYVPPPPPAAPVAQIFANGAPTYITASIDQAVVISWASANATSCTVAQNDLAARYTANVNGAIVAGTWVGPTWGGTSNPGVGIPTSVDGAIRDVTYYLTCSGPGGSATNAVRVRRYGWGAGGALQVGYVLGSQAEAMSCSQYIYAGVKLDPNCSDASWGTFWADGTQNPWWLKPGTQPGGGKWCTCFNPKTAGPGKPWLNHVLYK